MGHSVTNVCREGQCKPYIFLVDDSRAGNISKRTPLRDRCRSIVEVRLCRNGTLRDRRLLALQIRPFCPLWRQTLIFGWIL